MQPHCRTRRVGWGNRPGAQRRGAAQALVLGRAIAVALLRLLLRRLGGSSVLLGRGAVLLGGGCVLLGGGALLLARSGRSVAAVAAYGLRGGGAVAAGGRGGRGRLGVAAIGLLLGRARLLLLGVIGRVILQPRGAGEQRNLLGTELVAAPGQ